MNTVRILIIILFVQIRINESTEMDVVLDPGFSSLYKFDAISKICQDPGSKLTIKLMQNNSTYSSNIKIKGYCNGSYIYVKFLAEMKFDSGRYELVGFRGPKIYIIETINALIRIPIFMPRKGNQDFKLSLSKSMINISRDDIVIEKESAYSSDLYIRNVNNKKINIFLSGSPGGVHTVFVKGIKAYQLDVYHYAAKFETQYIMKNHSFEISLDRCFHIDGDSAIIYNKKKQKRVKVDVTLEKDETFKCFKIQGQNSSIIKNRHYAITTEYKYFTVDIQLIDIVVALPYQDVVLTYPVSKGGTTLKWYGFYKEWGLLKPSLFIQNTTHHILRVNASEPLEKYFAIGKSAKYLHNVWNLNTKKNLELIVISHPHSKISTLIKSHLLSITKNPVIILRRNNDKVLMKNTLGLEHNSSYLRIHKVGNNQKEVGTYELLINDIQIAQLKLIYLVRHGFKMGEDVVSKLVLPYKYNESFISIVNTTYPFKKIGTNYVVNDFRLSITFPKANCSTATTYNVSVHNDLYTYQIKLLLIRGDKTFSPIQGEATNITLDFCSNIQTVSLNIAYINKTLLLGKDIGEVRFQVTSSNEVQNIQIKPTSKKI